MRDFHELLPSTEPQLIIETGATDSQREKLMVVQQVLAQNPVLCLEILGEIGEEATRSREAEAAFQQAARMGNTPKNATQQAPADPTAETATPKPASAADTAKPKSEAEQRREEARKSLKQILRGYFEESLYGKSDFDEETWDAIDETDREQELLSKFLAYGQMIKNGVRPQENRRLQAEVAFDLNHNRLEIFTGRLVLWNQDAHPATDSLPRAV